MALTRSFIYCLFLCHWPSCAALADEGKECNGSDVSSCKTASSWQKVVQEDDGASALELLQMKGSAVSKKICPSPDYLKYDRHLKGCLSEDPNQCINGNFAYSTLSDAWAQCGIEKQCGAVLQDKDGFFYLRRESDPDIQIPKDSKEDFKFFPYACQEEKEEHIEKKKEEKKPKTDWDPEDDMVKKELAKQKADEVSSNKARQVDEDAFDAYVRQSEKEAMAQNEDDKRKVMDHEEQKQAALKERKRLKKELYDWKKEQRDKAEAEDRERRVKKAMELSMNKAMDDVENKLSKEGEEHVQDGKKHVNHKDTKKEDRQKTEKIDKKSVSKVEKPVEQKVAKKVENKANQKIVKKVGKEVEENGDQKGKKQSKKVEHKEVKVKKEEAASAQDRNDNVVESPKKEDKEKIESRTKVHTMEDSFTEYYNIRHQTMEDKFAHDYAVHQFEKNYPKLPREATDDDAKLVEDAKKRKARYIGTAADTSTSRRRRCRPFDSPGSTPTKVTKEQEVTEYFDVKHAEYEAWLEKGEERKKANHGQ